MDVEYICKKCNILHVKSKNLTNDFNCKKCKLEMFKIPNCQECDENIKYPLKYEFNSQFCDFCSSALCQKCCLTFKCGFFRCKDCGVSFCFKKKICDSVPIDEYGSHEECDCYRIMKEETKKELKFLL